MTSIAIPATSGSAPNTNTDTAAAMTSLLNVIHSEASQAKSSTDSAVVMPSDTGADAAQFSPIVVQSPAPALGTESSSLPLSDITRILKPIADSLRSDTEHKLRHPLAASTLLPKSTVALLQLTTSLTPITPDLIEAQIHILRLLANLCIDSEQNRAIMLTVEAPQAIITFLSAKLTPPPSSFTSAAPTQHDEFYYPLSTTPVLRTAIGALLNMQLQHEPTRAALRSSQSTFGLLAHIAYSPAIYPMNAATALLKGTHHGGQANLVFSGIANIHDPDEALDELQARSMTASWASQILLDLCSDRPQHQSSPEKPDGPSAELLSTDSADKVDDVDDDEEEEGEAPGEPNPNIIAANVPLSALVLPLAAYVPSSSSTYTTVKRSTAQLSEILAADEDALLTLMTADISLLQNAVQLLECVIGEGPAGAAEDEMTEEAGPSGSVNAQAAGSVRPKMLQRAELVRVPWPASAEAPALSQWLDTIAAPLSSASREEESEEAGTPTHDISSPSISSSSGLSLLMNFIEQGTAPVLATPSSFSQSTDVLLRAGATSFQRWTLSLAGALVELVSDDVCMEALFPPVHLLKTPVPAEGTDTASTKANAPASASSTAWFVDALKRWMGNVPQEIATPGGAEHLRSTALLAMGNLARTDSHCIALVQEHNLAPFLVSLLPASTSTDSSTLPTTQAAEIRLAHSVLSLLKNLSIPEPNKRIIGSLGVISRVVEGDYLEVAAKQEGSSVPKATKGVPLQVITAAVGLVKHLCRGEVDAAIEVVLGRQFGESVTVATSNKKTALAMLLKLINKTDEVAIRMESTRIIVGVVKSLWSSAAPTSGNEAAVRTAKQLLTSSQPSASAADQSNATPSIAQSVRAALAQMVRTAGKYPILVNEGVVALTLLASENADSAEGVAEALLWEPARGASGNSGTSGGSGSTAMAAPGAVGAGGAALSPISPILDSAGVSAPGEGPTIPSVIMAEPESFEPNPVSSNATDAGPAPGSSGGLAASSALRAGPVSNLLRTETNLPAPVHTSQQGGPHDGTPAHGLHTNSLLSHQHPHGQPGPRRQSTAEVYGQAGAASAGPAPPASPGRSPLGLSAPGRMDIDSPSSSAPTGPNPNNLQAAPQQPPAAPIRRASTNTNALTSPKTSALSMLDVVLGRRDARMPPHYASNAAVLVQMIVSAAPSSPSAATKDSEKAGATVVGVRTEESLERLVREGPEEALEAAKVALGVVRERLGKA